MLEKKKLDRINALAKKHKESGLSEAELIERDSLRKEYLTKFRQQFRGQLDSIKFVEDLAEEEVPPAHKKKS